MRIISGKYRGKKLAPPPQSSGIRPTTDRAKEAVFNILFDKIEGGVFFRLIFRQRRHRDRSFVERSEKSLFR